MNKTIKKELKYFNNHNHRCQYCYFKEEKLLCGSGIIESAIRKIINLRFKAPYLFWYENNTEKLIFLRATFLSRRWKRMINNYIKSELKVLK